MSDNLKLSKLTPLAKELEDRNLRTKAIAALERNLFAVNKVYDLKNKELVTYDDGPTQVKAALGLLAYTDGKPVERREIITRRAPTLEDLQKQAKSPEFRRALEELLAENPPG